MKSSYASKQLQQVIWQDFTAHFRTDVSIASYDCDISEFMDICKKDFIEICSKDAADYYGKMKDKVDSGQIKAGTMAKKMRELHSFAEFIVENRERYKVSDRFQDYFYPYLKLVAKQEKYARTIPIEHIDKLLEAAQDDLMAYCIFVLLQRAGLSSTEITELKPENFAGYDNGVYVFVPGRREPCFVPEDVFVILEQYLSTRTPNRYLFYNSRGNKLNTMYISRLMKKYTSLAGIPPYSAEALRNSCAFTMFAYNASPEQVAGQMGITKMQIKRYKNMSYKEELAKAAGRLVKIRIEPPQ